MEEKKDMAEVIAWAEKFIKKYHGVFERMHGYTPEMRRSDELAERLRKTRTKNSSGLQIDK